MTIKELKKYKKILILGHGIEGKSTERFLRKLVPSSKILIADKKTDPNYLKKQSQIDLVIKTPGIPKEKVTTLYTTAANIFFANVKGMTIGITGSKGKSTTASLIYEILKRGRLRVHLVGNIGNSMLGELLKTNREDDIFVVELSSFQLDDINYSPHVSVILNLFQEHMDYHKGFINYWLAKKRIVKKAKRDDYLIFNPSFKDLTKLANDSRARSIPFNQKIPFPVSKIPLLGEHNRDNVRAAATVARLFKISDKVVRSAIINFKPLPHRLEFIGEYKKIKFYDDAISTIPESAIAALKSISEVGTIFLGGEDRGYDFLPLVDYLKKLGVPNIVLFPDSGANILSTLKKKMNKSYHPVIFETTSMKDAVIFAFEKTPHGTICLLSSASPSFSLWKNFKEKGDLFKKWVTKYGKG